MWNWGFGIALLAAASLTEGGRRTCRSVAKQAIRAGLVVADKGTKILGECKEQAADLVAEVKQEKAATEGGEHTKNHAEHSHAGHATQE